MRGNGFHPARGKSKLSPITDTHYVIPQKRLFVLFVRQQCLERISRIHDAQRPGLPVDDGDMHEAAVCHHRQDISQAIARVAKADLPRHHLGGGCGAGASQAMTDPLDDVRFGDDARHHPIGIAHDDEADV